MSSRAVRVTLLEDRAEVTRRAVVAVPAGVSWVAIDGVSAFADDPTAQAGVEGGAATVLAVRVRRVLVRETQAGREALQALEDELRKASRRHAEAEAQVERAARDEERTDALVGEWAEAIGRVPARLREEDARRRWAAAFDALDERARATAVVAYEGRGRVATAALEAARAAERLAQGRVERPRLETVIEVQLRAEKSTPEVPVLVTYRVPCALWRPEHLARLLIDDEDARQGTIDLVTHATAWQLTGEEWGDVEMRFSTARPARQATPPLLQDDVLTQRKKTEQEKQKVVVELRDQTIALAGLAQGGKAVDEMPGVDDGGEPAVYVAREKVTLASDGRPFRIELTRARLPATVDRILFPERSPAAHLRAVAMNATPGALLAGPVRVARGGSLVGRSKTTFVGKGEPFELGFGADDAVRVRRDVKDERDTTLLTGTQKLKRKVTVFLSNLSDRPRRVVVTERVPVSELEAVQVSLVDAKIWAFDAKDGFAKCEVTLQGNATKELSLVYEVRASSKVVLPL